MHRRLTIGSIAANSRRCTYNVDGLPLSGVLNPYFARCRRAKAAHEKRKAEWRAEMDASIARARANWERTATRNAGPDDRSVPSPAQAGFRGSNNLHRT